MVNKRKKRNTSYIKEGFWSKAFDVFNIITLLVICFVMAYPLYYILVLSFNEGIDAYQGGIFLWPRKFTFDNYLVAFTNPQLASSFLVTIGRTLLGTVVSVFFIALMSYALSHKNLPGKRWITKYFFFTTLFNAGAIPMLLLIRDLDLLDRFMVYILPAVYGFINMLIVKITFDGIPHEVRESAQIDGAGEFTIFIKIYLPLAKSSIVTIALFTAVFHWNDWYAGKYYVSDPFLKPAATILQEMITSSAGSSMYLSGHTTTTSQTLQAAFVVIIMFPILLIYPWAQKYFVKGAIVGSIKE
ncbi:MAG: carbohydrate ABC transporter permease [Rhodospirillaceae bacterium]|nr:carbohydrate ABC transporter permease [Rhodospirillaceae bacterium]